MRQFSKIAVLAACGSLFAQDAIFRSDTRLVVLHATVQDRKGNLLTDLTREAFTVYENDVAQELKTFNREDVPVSIGLIIDNSGSMRDKTAKVASAALTLVKQSNPQDEVFIVNFNDDAYLDVPFTSDIKKMEEGLSRIDSRGGTAMRDAVTMSMDHLTGKARLDKKVLLIVTDGDDTSSQPSNTIEKLIGRAQQSEVLIYAIGLLAEEDRSARKRAERALEGLTESSGGLAYFPESVAEVEEIAVQVAHEIRNQYVLTYSPHVQELDGSYRRIKVEVDAKGSPRVRTRSGYYATPDEQPPADDASAAAFATGN